MAKTAGDVLVETLIDWGVDTIFGIPGDGINGVFEALRTRQGKVRFGRIRFDRCCFGGEESEVCEPLLIRSCPNPIPNVKHG